MLNSAGNMQWFWYMLRACFIYIFMHAVCMFHVTCMYLGLFHACCMHVTCMQQSSIRLCFLKVLKLWIACILTMRVISYSSQKLFNSKRFGDYSVTFLCAVQWKQMYRTQLNSGVLVGGVKRGKGGVKMIMIIIWGVGAVRTDFHTR